MNQLEHTCQPPIIQYWHSEDMPDYIAELVGSFRNLNPELPHITFSESSAATFIDEHFDARHVRAFEACAVPAMQADYLRYCATLALGGVYCDADLRCVGSLGPLIPAPGDAQFFQRERLGTVINALFAVGSPRHPLLELVLEIATANIGRRLSQNVYLTTGPRILTYLYWLSRLGSFDAVIAYFAEHRGSEVIPAYCEAIGDCTRAQRAFEGVEISPITEMGAFVRGPGELLPYQRHGGHWSHRQGSIFRADGRLDALRDHLG